VADTHEAYILKKLAKLEHDLAELTSNKDTTYNFCGIETKIYSDLSYIRLFHRLTGQIDILYMVLTGHDNIYQI